MDRGLLKLVSKALILGAMFSAVYWWLKTPRGNDSFEASRSEVLESPQDGSDLESDSGAAGGKSGIRSSSAGGLGASGVGAASGDFRGGGNAVAPIQTLLGSQLSMLSDKTLYEDTVPLRERAKGFASAAHRERLLSMVQDHYPAPHSLTLKQVRKGKPDRDGTPVDIEIWSDGRNDLFRFKKLDGSHNDTVRKDGWRYTFQFNSDGSLWMTNAYKEGEEKHQLTSMLYDNRGQPQVIVWMDHDESHLGQLMFEHLSPVAGVKYVWVGNDNIVRTYGSDQKLMDVYRLLGEGNAERLGPQGQAIDSWMLKDTGEFEWNPGARDASKKP